MSELKPRSFRIDDETTEKLREITQSIGGNQQQALTKLIEAFELQSGKSKLTEKSSDIEQFERYINAITRMFLGNLEDNENISNTIKAQFESQLKSKDSVIINLQDELKILKQESSEYSQVKNSLQEEINSLNNKIEKEYKPKLEDIKEELSNRDNQINILNDSYIDLKKSKDLISKLKEENDKLKEENNNLSKELINSKEEIILIKENCLKQIEEYQIKYKELLDNQYNQENKSKTTTRKSNTSKTKTTASKTSNTKKNESNESST